MTLKEELKKIFAPFIVSLLITTAPMPIVSLFFISSWGLAALLGWLIAIFGIMYIIVVVTAVVRFFDS